MNDTEKRLDQLDSAATGLTMLVDSARTIAGEMNDDFFERIDANSERGRIAILADFDRNRAKCFALCRLLWEMEQELREAGYTR